MPNASLQRTLPLSPLYRRTGSQAEQFSPNKVAQWPHLLPVNSRFFLIPVLTGDTTSPGEVDLGALEAEL